MICVHRFNSVEEYTDARTNNYSEPWVSHTNGKGVNYNKVPMQPLTFNILSNGNIGWKAYNSSSVRTIQYSKNGGEWTDITSTTSGVTISVVTGDVLRFKGDTWTGSSYYNYSCFTSTCTFEASGNPGSLKYGEVTYGDEPLGAYCYHYLFLDCTGLVKAPELSATTLTESCYHGMFRGCSGLMTETVPMLPAITLANNCYQEMFRNCTGLITAPVLPATTLADGCYMQMFQGCTGLTSAPELPVTTLCNACYNEMFENCTSLTTAPELPATTLTRSCYYYMFNGCRSLTTAPELPATTAAYYCYHTMFANCTSLTTAPELPATTLAEGCYFSMFFGCTGLTTAPELPATTLITYCYYQMFYNCSNLNYVKCLATTNMSVRYGLTSWLSNVSSTGTFYKATGVTYSSGASGIPSGWTIIEV